LIEAHLLRWVFICYVAECSLKSGGTQCKTFVYGALNPYRYHQTTTTRNSVFSVRQHVTSLRSTSRSTRAMRNRQCVNTGKEKDMTDYPERPECDFSQGTGHQERCSWCFCIFPAKLMIHRHNHWFCCIQHLLKWEAHNG